MIQSIIDYIDDFQEEVHMDLELDEDSQEYVYRISQYRESKIAQQAHGSCEQDDDHHHSNACDPFKGCSSVV